MKSYGIFFGLLFSLIHLSGCEGSFAAKKPVNLTILNGISDMKIVGVGGTNYLAVNNTNFELNAQNGTIQFYSLGDPTAPIRVDPLTVQTMSNVGDFTVDGNTLYFLDRNAYQVNVYDYTGSNFAQRLDSNQNPVLVQLSEDPQKIMAFTGNVVGATGIRLLAVVSQIGGTIHFIRTDTLQTVVIGASTAPNTIPDTKVVAGIPGALYYVNPRQETVANQNDPINLSAGEQQGQNMNGLLLLNRPPHTNFVVASFSNTALFNFRFDTFENNLNIDWDLGHFVDGEDNVQGSGQNGFRGITQDSIGNVYLSSRADDFVYQVSAAEIDRDKTPDGRNTRGYLIPNVETPDTHRLPFNFKGDPTSTVFPQLGNLVSDCSLNVGPITVACSSSSGAATRLWVLGVGANQVFRADLVAGNFASSVILDGEPERILWYPPWGNSSLPEGILYIADPVNNKISIVAASVDLTVINKLSN